LVKRILEELSSDDLKPLNEEISQIIKKIATDIEKRETKESNTKSEDKILVG
jgi:CHASE3 domain sensor protein